MSEPLTPNSYSPYADADPNYRHLIPSLFGIDPIPGKLTVAACGGMVVVRDGAFDDATETLDAGRTEDLPPGMCPICIAVASGQQHEPPGQRGTCSRCDGGSSHGDMCALCRQELHDAWWPTRDQCKCGYRAPELGPHPACPVHGAAAPKVGRSWKDIAPKDAADLNLAVDLSIDAPLNEMGERCPWPWEPQQLVGVPMGQYHCRHCGAMCVAGVPHPDYRDVPDGPGDEEIADA
jgi:hypothetical protein